MNVEWMKKMHAVKKAIYGIDQGRREQGGRKETEHGRKKEVKGGRERGKKIRWWHRSEISNGRDQR